MFLIKTLFVFDIVYIIAIEYTLHIESTVATTVVILWMYTTSFGCTTALPLTSVTVYHPHLLQTLIP